MVWWRSSARGTIILNLRVCVCVCVCVGGGRWGSQLQGVLERGCLSPSGKAGSTVRYGTKFFGLKVRFEITVRYIFRGTVRFESTIFFSYFFRTFFVPT